MRFLSLFLCSFSIHLFGIQKDDVIDCQPKVISSGLPNFIA